MKMEEKSSPLSREEEQDSAQEEMISTTPSKNNTETIEETPDKIPFLDTFYSLSDSSAETRSLAASSLIRHCFGSPPADENSDEEGGRTKDVTYALRRLLDGLNSGRAHARQGFAACLSSFLRVFFGSVDGPERDSLLEEMKIKWSVEEEVFEKGPMSFLRAELLSRTASEGKKKGSEERDCVFGRLFGILAVIRSGILFVEGDDQGDICELYMRDIVTLFEWKNWMREPSAHAMIVFLESMPEAQKEIRDTLVREVLMEKLLKDKEPKDLYPEQLAVGMYLQRSGYTTLNLEQPLLQESNFVAFGNILSSTSSSATTTYNAETKTFRKHLIWNQLMLTYQNSDQAQQDTIVRLLFLNLIPRNLLSNPTYERKAFALTILNDYFPIVSPSQLSEIVFCSPTLINGLFVHILAVKSKKISPGGGASILAPLAAEVLQNISEYSEKSPLKGLEIIKGLIEVEPRIDQKLKVPIVERWMSTVATSPEHAGLMDTFMDYLETKILNVGADAAEDDSISVSNVKGCVDLLYAATKIVAVANHDTEKENPTDAVRNRVLGFFSAGAFLDCANVEVPKKPKRKSKRKSVAKAQPELFVAAGVERIKTIISDDTKVPPSIRKYMSHRFFSVVSDWVMSGGTTARVSNLHKMEHAVEVLSSVIAAWEEMGTAIAPVVEKSKNDDDDDDEEEDDIPTMEQIKKVMEETQALLKRIKKEESKKGEGNEAKLRCVMGCSALLFSLYLQLLPNNNSINNEETEEEDEDEDDSDEIKNLIADLAHFLECIFDEKKDNSKMGDDGTEEEEKVTSNPLALLADISVTTLGLEGVNERGAGRMAREMVKLAWMGSLTHASCSEEENLTVDQDVMRIILDSVTGPLLEDEMEEEEDIDDEHVFSSAMDLDLDGSDDDQDDAEEKNGDSKEEQDQGDKEDQSEDDDDDDEDDEEEDIELDPSRLQSLLLEDNDEIMNDEEGGGLEHHAGADGALANLIKLKNSMRKKAQKERERNMVTHQMRCAVLLEVIFSPAAGADFNIDETSLWICVLSLVKARRNIEKKMTAPSASGGKSDGGFSDKKALMDRLTTLMKTKVYKTKLGEVTNLPAAVDIASRIMDEAKKSLNANHCSFCSSALLLVVKSTLGGGQLRQDADCLESISTLYRDAIEDWSTRKTTKLHTLLFEDLVSRYPSLARTILIKPISTAGANARSAFLKNESFGLLASMLKIKAPSDDTKDGANASTTAQDDIVHLQASALEVSASISSALEDEDLIKAKRIRDVLKTLEHLVSFALEHCKSDSLLWDSLKGDLTEKLQGLEKKTQSDGVKKTCLTLISKIQDMKVEKKIENNTKMEVEEREVKGQTPSKSVGKKKTKKSKKPKKK